MSQSESFDAFYARTSWNVTSQVHALTGEDPLADHAIREAYAKAYQQWYEVSTYPDPEAWVLNIANDAYQRRLAEAAALSGPALAAGHDPLSWPGMFRSARPPAQAASDPDATLDPRLARPAGPEPASPVSGSPVSGSPAPASAEPIGGALADAGPLAGAVAAGPSAALADGATPDWFTPSSRGATVGDPGRGDPTVDWPGQPNAMPTATMGERAVASTTRGRTGSLRLSRPVGGLTSRVLGSRRNLIAVATVVVVLLAGGLYLALSGSKPKHAATPPVTPPGGKPTIHMLTAGQTGSRSQIPWSIVGPGWTLAEVSTAQPASNGVATGGDRVTYLVDPQGGKYRIRTMSGAVQPMLVAWSGDAHEALYAVTGGPGSGPTSYSLLTLRSGQLTQLPLPAGVTPLGFTRPDGLNILTVRLQNSRYRLERYDLAGAYQATVSTLQRPAGPVALVQVNALSSPDGTTAVWGVSGDGMELVSNAGGLIRKLRVPAAGAPKSCTPVSWWTDTSVLTYCNAGQPDAGRLWLVPTGGGQPTRLTGISGSPSGQGGLTGAWQAGGIVYVTSTTFTQCQGAASGPGGLQILQVGNGGGETALTIPATTNNHAEIVAGLDGRLLVLAQTSCPGTSSLIWFNPSARTAEPLLTEPSTQAGVISAVPYASGPATVGG
jgi:hypothetical protein